MIMSYNSSLVQLLLVLIFIFYLFCYSFMLPKNWGFGTYFTKCIAL